jgi:predicted DNA-binding protein (MmcQ/YjbR family)
VRASDALSQAEARALVARSHALVVARLPRKDRDALPAVSPSTRTKA